MKFEEMPNGQTRMVLTPWKCSECGVCMNVCSNKGFDGMKLYQLTTLGPVVLHKCTKTLCKQCGKPIAPDSAEGLCSVCRIKARLPGGQPAEKRTARRRHNPDRGQLLHRPLQRGRGTGRGGTRRPAHIHLAYDGLELVVEE